jgi:hypothetical protein
MIKAKFYAKVKWPGYCFHISMKKVTMHLSEPWNELKEHLKEANCNLTDEDLIFEPGQEMVLLERLAKKMGRETAHIKAWIESVSFNRRQAF